MRLVAMPMRIPTALYIVSDSCFKSYGHLKQKDAWVFYDVVICYKLFV